MSDDRLARQHFDRLLEALCSPTMGLSTHGSWAISWEASRFFPGERRVSPLRCFSAPPASDAADQ